MLLFFIVPILIAKIKKYKLTDILKLYWLYPVFGLELVLMFFQVTVMFKYYGFVKYASIMQYAFHLSLLFPIVAYKLYKPAVFGASGVIAGSALNRIVIHANGGKMPVCPTLSKVTGFYSEGVLEMGVDDLHILMTDTTKLNFLGDYIDFGFTVMSIGDLLIHAFVSITIFYSIKYKLSCDREG